MGLPDIIRAVQTKLGLAPDGFAGAITWGAIAKALGVDPAAPLTPAPASAPPAAAPASPARPVWPFTARIDGDDIVVDDIVITCFGGAFDPQDDGRTASGVNTKSDPSILGVSVAMDGRAFDGLTPREHAALDYAPLPRMPWHTPVEVTIDGHTETAGIIDLGPGRQASEPGAPHALDLTIALAARFPAARNLSMRALAREFEARGSFRIPGAAKYLAIHQELGNHLNA